MLNMDNIIIRKANKNDIDALENMRIGLQKHLEERDPEVWKFSETGYASIRREILLRLESRACFMGIASTEAGVPVGMVMAELVKNTGVVPDLYGHIHWLYVKELARRLGTGRRLIHFTNIFFKACNVDYVTVGYVVNNIEAAEFWPSLGFRPRVMHSVITREQLSHLTDGLPPVVDI
jgi:ribosomal protein S18 acetylase RimI-like enzyme